MPLTTLITLNFCHPWNRYTNTIKDLTRFALLLFVFLLCSETSSFAQDLDRQIDFRVSNSTVDEALKKLAEETEINFAYSRNFFRKASPISIDKKSSSIKEILTEILWRSNVDFKVINQQIILSKRKANHFTISGFIEDKSAGERLVAATIYCPEQGKGVVSNEYGFYSLTLDPGPVELMVSYLGYEKHRLHFELQENQEHNLKLDRNLTLEEVVVVPKDNVNFSTDENLNGSLLVPSHPTFGAASGGSDDLIQSARAQAGIQGGIDGLGGTLVRGGEAEQNLVLLDGSPVYIPYHLLGIFSTFNPDAIKSARLFTGAFPARYGGRLSSILDIRAKEGNTHEWKAGGSVDLLNMRAFVEGPLKAERSSIFLASRYSPNGFFLLPTLKRNYFRNQEGKMNSVFHDTNAKVNLQLSDRDRLYLSLFNGSDEVESQQRSSDGPKSKENESSISWWNTLAAIRWNRNLSQKAFLNTTLNFSKYGSKYSTLDEFFQEQGMGRRENYFFDTRSNNQDISLRTDLDLMLPSKHRLRLGAGVSYRIFKPDITYIEEQDDNADEEDDRGLMDFDRFISSEHFKTMESFIHLEDDFPINSTLSTKVGLRLSHFHNEGQNYVQVEPRISLQQEIGSQSFFQASSSLMTQNLHLVSTSSLQLPNDLWIPSDENLRPQKAWQTNFGFKTQGKDRWSFQTTAYYKYMWHLKSFPDNSPYLSNLDEFSILDEIIEGYGRSYGIENSIYLKFRKTQWALSYTLAKSERKFEEQNENEWYPFNFDQRHQVKLHFETPISESFSFSSSWYYNSATPRFSILAIQEGQGLIDIDVSPPGEKNSVRSKAYHKLDVLLQYRKTFRRSSHKLSIGVSNLYNRKNIAYYTADFENDQMPSTKAVFSFPLLPTFGYSVSF